MGSRYAQILRQMVSLRVKTRSSTNKVDSRHKKGRGPLGRCLTSCCQAFLKNDLLIIYLYIYIIYYIYIYIIYYISSLTCNSALLPENVNRSTRLNFIKGQMNQKMTYFLLSLYLHQTLKRNILSEIWVKIFLPKPL